MIRCSEREGAIVFTVRVVPRASKSVLAGEHNGALRVHVAAPPVDGAANEELVRTLARAFGLQQRDVEITGGHSSRTKHVRLSGATRERLELLATESNKRT